MSEPTWLDLARKTAPCRPDVSRLRDALRGVDPAEVEATLDRALAAQEFDPAQALFLAGVAAGRPPEARRLIEVLGLLDASWEVVAALVGAYPGDKVELLLAAVESRRLGIDWEVEALRLAVALLEGESRAAPPALLRALRLTARTGEVSEDLAPLLAEAVAVTGNADARALTRAWEDGKDPHQTWLAAMRKEMARPLLEALPEEPPARGTGAYTVRRAAEKVGRNDPCPCGSGKKFKKCCEGKAAEREQDASPVEGATLAEVLADPGKWLSLEQLSQLALRDLLRLDAKQATPEQLSRLAQSLARSGYWDRALGLTGVLCERLGGEPAAAPAPDGPDPLAPLDELVHGLVTEAELQGASEPLVRLLDRWSGRLADQFPALRRALQLRGPDGLDRLEADALAYLKGGERHGDELAYAVLSARPALGIILARGLLDPRRPQVGDAILGEVERARDQLLLPPGDPMWADWDRLTGRKRDVARAEPEPGAEEEQEEDPAVLRERLRELATRNSDLEQALERERREQKRGGAAPPIVARVEPEEVRRLREKVEELKALVATGAEERRALREQLRAAEAAREEQESERTGAEAAVREEGDDEGEAFPASERAPVVPTFSEGAARTLRELDPPTARLALKVILRLASGDPGAWSGAKRLQKVRDLASARVGIHHRLLFRVRAGELEVVDLIHRRELDATLRRR